MTEIVIQHCGSIPNVDAREACISFAFRNYTQRKRGGYRDTMEITTKRGLKVEVKEQKHDNQDSSPCSVVFHVKNLDVRQPPGIGE